MHLGIYTPTWVDILRAYSNRVVRDLIKIPTIILFLMCFDTFKLALFEIKFSVVSSSSAWKMLPLLGKMSIEGQTPPIQPLELLHSVVWRLSSQSPTPDRSMGAVPTEQVCEVTTDDPPSAVECCLPLTQELTTHGVL